MDSLTPEQRERVVKSIEESAKAFMLACNSFMHMANAIEKLAVAAEQESKVPRR